MKFKNYTVEAAFAISHVRKAAVLAKKIQQEMRAAAFTKDDKSPVTVADFAVQAFIAGALQKHFPKDSLVGEESAEELKKPSGKAILERICAYLKILAPELSGSDQACQWLDLGLGAPAKRFWTIDPIDGTKGFVRGDQFAVALALIENGDLKVGILGCPNLTGGSEMDPNGPGSLIVAVRGEGTWLQPLNDAAADWKRLRTSNCKKSSESVVLRSFEKSHVDSTQMNRLVSELGIQKGPVQLDSLAKYAVLAAGAADLMLRFPTEKHPYEYIWDQAAGQIAIEEAGGRVTDLEGKVLDYTQGRRLSANRGVLLSNGPLHDIVLKAVKTSLS